MTKDQGRADGKSFEVSAHSCAEASQETAPWDVECTLLQWKIQGIDPNATAVQLKTSWAHDHWPWFAKCAQRRIL